MYAQSHGMFGMFGMIIKNAIQVQLDWPCVFSQLLFDTHKCRLGTGTVTLAGLLAVHTLCTW